MTVAMLCARMLKWGLIEMSEEATGFGVPDARPNRIDGQGRTCPPGE